MPTNNGPTTPTHSTPSNPPAGDLARVPPQSIEAEMAVLGAMMLEGEVAGLVLPIIGREESRRFYRPDHRLIYEILVDLYDQNRAIDSVVVKDELIRRGVFEQVGGIEYLVRIVESVPSAANAEHYARIVRDKGLLRDLIVAGGEIIAEAYAPTEQAAEILDRA